MKRFLILCLLFAPLLAFAARTGDFDSAAENEIVALINKERTERGLKPVHLDERLTKAARLHTEGMIEKHDLTHRLSGEAVLRERVAATGIPFDVAGENVAYDANAHSAHVSFMHSPGHRANILEPKFNAVGIGVEHSGNIIWVTEDFARRMDTTSASEAASIINKKFGELRRAEGSPPAKEHANPMLGSIACNMAREDKLDTKSPRSLPNVRGVMAWTATDPGALPRQVKQLADDRTATKYSLGVCYASSASYPNKVFWLVMAIY